MTGRSTIILDPATLEFCASAARAAADGIAPARAHYMVASATLKAFADELSAIAKSVGHDGK